MPPQNAHHHGASRYGSSSSHQHSSRSGKPVTKLELASIPSMDKPAYYDTPGSPSSSTSSDDSIENAPRNLLTNSGNKLNPSARFMRRGKMYAWGPQYEEAKADRLVRKRLQLCLEQLLPDAAAEVGAQVPQNIVDADAKRNERKRKRGNEKDCILPHLRSPSPPMTTSKLAPMLALPRTYVDILTSPSMRHTLGDDNMESGLQKTAGELLEGEKPLMQALGRLKDIARLLERDAPTESKLAAFRFTNAEPSVNVEPTETSSSATLPNQSRDSRIIPPLPHISDTDNLWRVTQELLGPPGPQTSVPAPDILFTATRPDEIPPINTADPENPQPVPTPLQRLFTCPGGITLHAIPSPAHPGMRYPRDHSLHPATIKYNLDMTHQCRAVDDALERVAELLADCNEYKERLEEARDRVADVARARKRVWKVIKERGGWELDRKETSKEA